MSIPMDQKVLVEGWLINHRFVIARLLLREASQSRFLHKICHCEPAGGGRGNLYFFKNFLLKARLPRLNANAFRLAMTERQSASLLLTIIRCVL